MPVRDDDREDLNGTRGLLVTAEWRSPLHLLRPTQPSPMRWRLTSSSQCFNRSNRSNLLLGHKVIGNFSVVLSAPMPSWHQSRARTICGVHIRASNDKGTCPSACQRGMQQTRGEGKGCLCRSSGRPPCRSRGMTYLIEDDRRSCRNKQINTAPLCDSGIRL
ncbi:hypothetical protein LZ30DRAFT_113569 [Colletotrichum cereale]|nr:hypothetical protein LZ30DRAFT_113569 [Colletotrichum cereale]